MALLQVIVSDSIGQELESAGPSQHQSESNIVPIELDNVTAEITDIQVSLCQSKW